MSICKKEIRIKTNRLTILLVCALLVLPIVLYVTNFIPNLVFASITAEQVESIVVYEPYGERKAVLSEVDMKALCALLRDIRLMGRSVRLLVAENRNPQYTVNLKSGISFGVACYSDYYIVNGRSYSAEGVHRNNYKDISKLYHDVHLVNRGYFPREDQEG